jgi:hypothetical protein
VRLAQRFTLQTTPEIVILSKAKLQRSPESFRGRGQAFNLGSISKIDRFNKNNPEMFRFPQHDSAT